MAARRRTLESIPEIRRFLLENVRPTGRALGVGSYGSVEEVEVNGLICAGKKIHEVLINEGVTARKYVAECQLMSDLRHPHIVQFLGLCFLEDSSLPVLVMEKLMTSLDELLENTPNIPLGLKKSILADVVRGLIYLHSHKPSPIIHRDLSAKNVLLNSALVAKISDLGNSRIVDFQPGQLVRTLSRAPGTAVYMPPEALDATARYGPSLDIFSFGHLSLFTLTQVITLFTLLHVLAANVTNLPYYCDGITCTLARLHFLRFFLEISDPTHTLILTIEDVLLLEVKWNVAKHTSLVSTSSLVKRTVWHSWSRDVWTTTQSTGHQLWISCNSWRQ